MNRVTEPGTVLLYDGELARVVGIAEGRTIVLELLDAKDCLACGRSTRLHVLEHSPMFQENAKPVPTLESA